MPLFNVIQWKNKPGEIIYNFPEGSLVIGSQLIVMENQEAIIFKEGKAFDSFGSGRHTLSTKNVPLLKEVVNLPFGGNSPFPAEVYFVNKTEIPNLKWGTKQPIIFQDPIYRIPVPIRAFGTFSIKIKDARSFLIMAIGTWRAFTSEIVSTTLRDQIILPKLSDLIAEFILTKNITILIIAQYYDQIGISGKEKIQADFSSYGIELLRFAVESINVPDDDDSVKRLKKALSDSAEIGIMGQENYKMRRTFDTMEKAAESGGAAGGLLGAGIGVGIGQQMGGMISPLISGVLTKLSCPFCNAQNNQDAKFCSSCGKELSSKITCSKCGVEISSLDKFCSKCGSKV